MWKAATNIVAVKCTYHIIIVKTGKQTVMVENTMYLSRCVDFRITLYGLQSIGYRSILNWNGLQMQHPDINLSLLGYDWSMFFIQPTIYQTTMMLYYIYKMSDQLASVASFPQSQSVFPPYIHTYKHFWKHFWLYKKHHKGSIMSPPFIRDATSGFWGYPTSTMDWCEENYAVSWYIAEFWNTLSNIFFIVPPMVAAYHLKRSRMCEDRYITTLMILTIIGFGSFAFHCSLLYQSQLLDELPMIYGTCAMFYCILECNKAEYGVLNRVYFILFILISILVTVVYISFENPLIFLVILYSFSLSTTAMREDKMGGIGRYAGKYEGCKQLLIISTASYGFGFILWNIDNEFCYGVRDVRDALPSLFRPFFQLHAWWHFFAGIGTYLCIMYSVHIRMKCLGYRPRLKYLFKFIPCYERDGPPPKPVSTSWTDMNKNLKNSKYRSNGSVGNFARLL